MKDSTSKFLYACTLSIALAGSAAVVFSAATPLPAFADSGNGNGGGNGGGNSGGNGNGGGNGGGNGNGGGGNGNGNGGGNGGGNGNSGGSGYTAKADQAGGPGTAKAENATPSKPRKSGKKSTADDLGLSASDLGALNAAHASPNALAKSSPNSRVGKLAAYKAAVLEGEATAAELDEKKAELEAMDPPDRPIEDIQADADAATSDVEAAQATVGQLEADLAAVGGDDDAIEAELEEARANLADAEAEKAAADAELAAAEDYAQLSEEVAELEEAVENQPEVERALLEKAANKPVTDEVEAAVKKLLGL